MKRTMLIFLVIFIVTVSMVPVQAYPGQETAVNNLSNPSFNWVETTFNFGSIKLGIPVIHEFSFTNDGDGPLIITSVKATCGCTVTDYSRDPVSPGEQGFVRATFNAAKPGPFSKTVTVLSNTGEKAIVLTIKGEVVE